MGRLPGPGSFVYDTVWRASVKVYHDPATSEMTIRYVLVIFFLLMAFWGLPGAYARSDNEQVERNRLGISVRAPSASDGFISRHLKPVAGAPGSEKNRDRGDRDPSVELSVGSALESAGTLLQEGKPRAALEALQPIEQIEPKNPWLWFYRGLAHCRLGNAYRALESFDRALEVLAEFGNPDPQLTEAIRKYRRQARCQVLSLNYQTGLAYDTNVSFLGDAATGPGLITGRRDGKFASNFEFQYAPVATEDQALVLSGRLGHTWHFAVEQFDYQDYGSSIRYARRLERHWQASVQYDYDMMFLDNEPFLSNHSLTPGLQFDWHPGTQTFALDKTNVYYQFSGRDFLFETEPEFDRDGIVNAIGVEQSFLFRPLPATSRTGDLTLGYRFESVSTQGSEFDRNDHDFYVGFGLPLLRPWAPDEYLILPEKELVFRFQVDFQIGDYRDLGLLDRFERQRRDHITTYNFCVSQKILEHPDYGDLTLHGIINWTDARANVEMRDGSDPFTYDKVVYGVQLEWSW